MTVAEIRAALDAVLREIDGEQQSVRMNSHGWSTGEFNCTAHDEGSACCIDPGHRDYNLMLDSLAQRLARRLSAAAPTLPPPPPQHGEEYGDPNRPWSDGDE